MNKSIKNYRPDVDGLRAISILLVVIFHAFPKYLTGGFIGVDIFFVISGYLITKTIFFSIEKNSFSFKDFYVKRVKRIFPALITVLFFTILFGWIVLTPAEYEQLGTHVATSSGFIENLWLWKEAGYFDKASETKPLLHLWSLGIEEQFYFIWPPVLIWIVKKNKEYIKYLLILIFISFGWNIYLSTVDITVDFYSPLTRFWELLLGAILSNNIKEGFLSKIKLYSFNNSWLGFFLIIISSFEFTSNYFPGIKALMPTLGALLIIANQNSSFNSSILKSKILVWFGVISYPLYLWHWVLLTFLRIMKAGEVSNIEVISTVLVSIIFAFITYKFIERPIRFGNGNKSFIKYLIVFLVFLMLIGIIIRKNDGFKFRHKTLFNADPATMTLGFDKSKLVRQCGIKASYIDKYQYCYEDPRSESSYAIIGDSKAEALYYGLVRESGKNQSWILIGSVSPINFMSTDQEVVEKAERAYDTINNNPKIKLVVLANTFENITPFDKENNVINQTISDKELIKKITIYSSIIKKFNNKKVYFLIDNPLLPDPTSCIEGKLINIKYLDKIFYRQKNKNCEIKYTDYLTQIKTYMKFTNELKKINPELIIYNPTELLCDVKKNICTVTKKGKFLYSYSNHISDYANSLVAKDFLTLINKN